MRALVTGICLAAVLAGCNLRLDGRVYVSDIILASQKGATSTGEIEYLVPVSSDNQCKQYGEKVARSLRQIDNEMRFISCQTVGMDSFMLLRSELAITGAESVSMQSQNGLVSIIAGSTDPFECSFGPCKVIGLVIKLNQKYEDIKSRVIKAFDGALFVDEPKSIRVSVKIENDTPSETFVSAPNAFLDSFPSLGERADIKTLYRRQSATITLSDVASAGLMKGRVLTLGAIFHR